MAADSPHLFDGLPPDLLDGAPFALLHRPLSTGPDRLELFRGEVTEHARLDELPLADAGGTGGPDVLAVVPYRQITELGYACHDDGSPLLALKIAERQLLDKSTFLDRAPQIPVVLEGGGFDLPDDRYAEIVRAVLRDEIGTGEGANFVVKRAYRATIADHSPRTSLSLFRRLLLAERGAYWSFLVHTGERTFLGITPERHVSLEHGVATMNPISGTFRYPEGGPTLDGLLDFLGDRKEVEELYMVVDEELKMMARVCDGDLAVLGPRLKGMRRLAHTEYLVQGRTSLDPRSVLRETMFAPTVTGSPVANATRVLSRYEPVGRGYYSGAVALFGHDARGGHTLDSAIMIRTAEVDRSGALALGVGATLVRHSDPDHEVAETHAKAAGFLTALHHDGQDGTAEPAALPDGEDVQRMLLSRNDHLARFWLCPEAAASWRRPELAGLRALVVDNEDAFTSMLAHQLRALGLSVRVVPWQYAAPAGEDLVVPGPGPGDPRRDDEPKIRALRELLGGLLRDRTPMLAICLSHQVLSGLLGLDLVRRDAPHQGVQRTIDFFGTPHRAGFYNAFTARSGTGHLLSAAHPDPVRVSRDPLTGDVHALGGHGFTSVQFHPESLLTEHGPQLLHRLVSTALWPGTHQHLRLPTALGTDLPHVSRQPDLVTTRGDR